MKSILRITLINSFSIWFASLIATGFRISGGATTIVVAGFVLFLIQKLLKPVLQLIALPFNLLTFGLFSWVINIITLYLLTVFVDQVQVLPFTFPGVHFADFVIPEMKFTLLTAFVAVSLTLTVIQNLLNWLAKS